MKRSKTIVMGSSAGGLNAIGKIAKSLPEDFTIPIIIVQHVGTQSNDFWVNNLNSLCKLEVKEAEEKEPIQKGFVYLAPPNYHLLVENDKTFSLSADERVNFSRPSIDVLFETASDTFKKDLIGIILTGSSKDGASGMQKIKKNGGLTIAQDPSTAEYGFMPEAALNITKIDHVLPLEEIIQLLIKLNSDIFYDNNH